MEIIIFSQTSKKNAESKMMRLVGNKVYGTIGFCNFHLTKDFSDYVSDKEIEENPTATDYYEYHNMHKWCIKASSTYHSETTIQNMYKSNGKKW
jgi:hypothetical protein